MEEKFNISFSKFLSSKSIIRIPSQQKYDNMVATIQKWSDKKLEKCSKEEFNLINRFTIRIEQSKPILYHASSGKENKNQRVVAQEEMFDILNTSHQKLGHGGECVMWQDLRNFYGISKEIISLFLKTCMECELKQGRAKKGIVIKPILSEDRNSRAQIDLIDLQSCPADDYKHILVYQDHLTKFIVLRPLYQKTAVEVVGHLKEIFGTFGAPSILQSDNGREFVNRLVNDLLRSWPECRLVHGRPRHSQSQGSVERANLDIQRILCTYLRTNQTSNWAKALPIVQAMKNRRFHRGIGRSPFEAMFGRKMILGNENGQIPTDEERGILEEAETQDKEIIIDWNEAVKNALSNDPDFVPSSDDEIEEAEEAALLDKRQLEIEEQRKGARESQAIQAQKMLQESEKRYSAVEIGQSVRIAIDPVDRPKLGHQNLLAVVTDVNSDGQYKMGTKAGKLPQRFHRNQFEPCSTAFLTIDDVPPNETSFRAAVGSQSVVGTQGHKHCNCTGGCDNNKCQCKKAGRICNSRCHHSNSCNNK